MFLHVVLMGIHVGQEDTQIHQYMLSKNFLTCRIQKVFILPCLALIELFVKNMALWQCIFPFLFFFFYMSAESEHARNSFFPAGKLILPQMAHIVRSTLAASEGVWVHLAVGCPRKPHFDKQQTTFVMSQFETFISVI